MAHAGSSEGPSTDLAIAILHKLSQKDPFVSAQEFPDTKSTDVRGALDKLAARLMVSFETLERDEAILEPEGEEIAAKGSHEARVFEALRQAMDGLTIPDLEKAIGDKTVTRLGQGKAFKEKWITKTKDGKFKAAVSL